MVCFHAARAFYPSRADTAMYADTATYASGDRQLLYGTTMVGLHEYWLTSWSLVSTVGPHDIKTGRPVGMFVAGAGAPDTPLGWQPTAQSSASADLHCHIRLREARWLGIGAAVTYRVGLRSRSADSHAMPRRCRHTTSLPQSARIASGLGPNRLPHCSSGSESSEGDRCDLISASGLLT
jgi:hypothetical protein